MVTLDLNSLDQILPAELIAQLNGKMTTELYLSWPIKKRSGKLRWLDAPVDSLKRAQEILLQTVLYTFEPHPSAVGFRPGLGIIEGPIKHFGAAVLLNIDLKDFFNSIKQPDLINASSFLAGNLESLGLIKDKEAAATTIRNLCLFKGRLPQGAPTSPAMSNIVCYPLDKELSDSCKRVDITYSRYADDMTFSSKDKNVDMKKFLDETVRPILEKYSFAVINSEKTRILRKHRRMTVTGVVINDKFGIPKWKAKNFRAHLHNLIVSGETINNAHYQKLQGFIAWMTSLNPTKGALLQQELKKIPLKAKPDLKFDRTPLHHLSPMNG